MRHVDLTCGLDVFGGTKVMRKRKENTWMVKIRVPIRNNVYGRNSQRMKDNNLYQITKKLFILICYREFEWKNLEFFH